MAIAAAETTGGELVRRLLVVAVLLPLGLGWLRLEGERRGWFDAGTGTALTMLVVIVIFSVTVWVGGWWVTRSEAALRASKEATRRQLSEIQAIYDSAHVGLFVLDRDLRYLRINRRLAEINGVPPEDHVGRRVEDVVPALAPLLGEVAERVLRTGESVTDVEVTGVTRPGVERTLRQQWVPLVDDSGHVVGINVVAEEITERKRAEDALRRSEDRLKALVRASSQAVFRMSPDWGEMLELQGGAFLADTGKPNPAWVQQYVHVDDRPRVLEAVAEAVRTGNPFTLEYRVLQADGSVGWTAARAVPVRDAKGTIVEWFGAATDITPRRQAEEALQHSQNRLATALEIAALGIWEYDLPSGLFSYDERCREVFGLAADDATTGDTVLALVHPDDRARVRQEMDDAVSPGGRGLYDIEFRVARRDGTERWVAGRGHAVRLADDAQETARLVGTLMDITDRRQAEEALREANARLADADRRKDEFIAILSHEIRNPLAPIRYALPLLEREALGDSAARAIAVIHRQVDHLTRLVDDFFDLSRINRGQIELRREDLSLETVLKTAIEAASPAIVAGRHVLTTDLAAPPVWINADRDRLAQVVTNLLNNAAKYTPSGGQIRLETEERDGQAVIRVRDNGMGLDPDSLPGLFEMFQQGKRANRPQGGLGIGLAFARRLVEMHGGTIEAHSGGIGQGAEFVVRLPAGAGASTREADRAVPGASPATRLKVLVVDDNPDLVQMLGVMLESDGHEVRKAFDGRSAILTARAFRPHVVLLDLGLPVMGGLDVAQELRRHPETAGARLVALTGWGQAQDRKQTREAGFDHHLTKPTDPQVLQQLLAEFANELPGGKQG
jgi:PAS domain S-box-containing protein